jgi:hypothetical protein
MYDKAAFESKCKELDVELHELNLKSQDSVYVLDGIINVEKYLAAKYKILWILKEPYGEWEKGDSLCKEIDKKRSWDEQPSSGRPTYRPMIYASYGILNDFILWKEIPSIGNEYVYATIKSIAYINIKKNPGESTSSPSQIKKSYKENKDFLLRQIITYNPDIIIGGYTLPLFFNDLNIPIENKRIISHIIHCYPTKNKLYLDTFHPSVRSSTCSEEDYCNSIISTVKDWVNNQYE